MKDLTDRMEHIVEAVGTPDDRFLLCMLLENAWINMRVADEPEVHQAYVTIICELIPTSRSKEAKEIMARAWEDTETERERSLKS